MELILFTAIAIIIGIAIIIAFLVEMMEQHCPSLVDKIVKYLSEDKE